MISEAYHMDCMVAMREMPDNAFDLAVVDPPYGIDITSRPARSNSVHVEREREREPRQSEAAGRSEVRIQVGGGLLSCPKATTLLTIKRHQMRNTFPKSKE